MKYCQRCGAQNDDGGVFCSRCGSSLAAPTAQVGPTVVVVGGPQQAPVGSNPGTVWLVLNIVSLVVFCCSGFIFNVLGIVFGGMATSDFNKGLYSQSKSHANVAKWMFFIGLALALVGIAVSFIFGLLTPLIAWITSVASSSGLS